MPESYTQVPPNSTGNKMRTRSRVIGSDTVHEQGVFQGALPTYYALADAVWSKALESSLTAEQMLRIMAAALAGQRSGLGTATETYTGLDGATARIILTPDQNGNGTPAVNGAA